MYFVNAPHFLHAFVHFAKIQSVPPLTKEAFLGIFNVMWWCKDDYNIKKSFKALIFTSLLFISKHE